VLPYPIEKIKEIILQKEERESQFQKSKSPYLRGPGGIWIL
jgi:hypothetical protein